MSLKGDLIAIGIGGAILAAAAWYAKNKLEVVAPKVLAAVDPTNDQNIVNQTVTGFYQAVTGSNGSIGGDIYDATHGGRLDITSSNNYAASSVDWIGERLSGNPNWSLGSAIYDWTHW